MPFYFSNKKGKKTKRPQEIGPHTTNEENLTKHTIILYFTF